MRKLLFLFMLATATIAHSQDIVSVDKTVPTHVTNVKYGVKAVEQYCRDGQWVSRVTYTVNADGNISEEVISYEGAAYNTWYQNYNSGAYLMLEILNRHGVSNADTTGIEDKFINK